MLIPKQTQIGIEFYWCVYDTDKEDFIISSPCFDKYWTRRGCQFAIDCQDQNLNPAIIRITDIIFAIIRCGKICIYLNDEYAENLLIEMADDLEKEVLLTAVNKKTNIKSECVCFSYDIDDIEIYNIVEHFIRNIKKQCSEVGYKQNKFPFKQIENLKAKIEYKQYEKDCRKANKKYGDYTLENDNLKFIWGVKSWDDLTGCDANLYTMNDIDICYDKNKNVYMLGIETAYYFKDYESECRYLKQCLQAFTKYMDDNNLNKNERFSLFMNNPCTSMTAKTIEELYANFRIFVNGYCSLKENVN